MAGTSIKARKHILELSRFFADGRAATEELIDELLGRYRKRKFLKQTLRRLIQKGFISRKGQKFSPTKPGLRFFRSNLIGSADKTQLDKKSWDGKWYLITFDIPIALNVKRDRLRQVLKNYNFYPLQKSVWVGPNKFAGALWGFIVNEEIEKYCKVMIVEVIEGDEELRRNFKLV